LKVKFGNVVIYVVLFFIMLFFLFPYFWMILSAFKTPVQTYAYPPVWIFTPTLKNFTSLLTDYNILFYLKNTLLVTIPTTLLALIIGLPAAYSFARFRFRFKEGLFASFLILQLFPSVSALIAFYFIAHSIGLYDTQLMLILAYLVWNVPLVIWLMRGFVEEASPEVEESAMVDGYSRLGAFFRVTLPSILPGLMVTSILVFITAWNEFTLAYFLTEVNAKTLPTMVGLFRTQTGTMWGMIFGLSFLSTLPVVILALAIRKHFVTGLTFGAIKK